MSSFRNNKNRKFYRINQYINAPTVRLLDDSGKQIGIVSIEEARQKAIENGLDLVEINGKAVPPVIKLISFSKFKYQESKKLKAEKKGVKGGDLKEVQMSPFIGQGDYETRLKRSKKFLTTGNKIKLSIKFQGRQMNHKEFGYDLIKKVIIDLKDFALPEGEARLIGRRLMLTFTPSKKNKETKNEETK
jgi:translation initiation factor IF-3